MTKTIGSGGDYSDLAAAIAAAPSDLNWEILPGNAGGGVLPAGVTLRPYSGAGVDKLVDAGESGFACLGDLVVQQSNIDIQGLRIGRIIGSLDNKSNITIKHNQFIANGSTPYSYFAAKGNCTGIAFSDNVIFFDEWTHANPALALQFSAGFGPFGGTISGEISRNTIVNRGADTLHDGIRLLTNNAASVVNVDCYDNAVFGAQTCFKKQGVGTFNVNAGNNASSDGTAGDFGGSGHLTSQVAADWFVDPASDVNLKSGSPGIGAGSAGNIGAAQ